MPRRSQAIVGTESVLVGRRVVVVDGVEGIGNEMVGKYK